MSIMEIEYKGFTIKVQNNSFLSSNILYNVWTPQGKFWGFKYTIVDARKWIDEEITCGFNNEK